MNLPRSVVLDLLPLYLAGEVSEETRAMIDEYLGTDPSMAEVVRKTAQGARAEETPPALNREERIEAFVRAKRLIFLRTLVIVSAITLVVLVLILPLVIRFLGR